MAEFRFQVFESNSSQQLSDMVLTKRVSPVSDPVGYPCYSGYHCPFWQVTGRACAYNLARL